jgi:hypothetical protein
MPFGWRWMRVAGKGEEIWEYVLGRFVDHAEAEAETEASTRTRTVLFRALNGLAPEKVPLFFSNDVVRARFGESYIRHLLALYTDFRKASKATYPG